MSAGRIIDRFPAGSAPLGVAVHPDINLALVTDNGTKNAAPGSLELIQLAYPTTLGVCPAGIDWTGAIQFGAALAEPAVTTFVRDRRGP